MSRGLGDVYKRQLSPFADDMIVYMENPIDSTKKLLDLINEFGKTAGTKSILRNQRHSYIPTTKLQKQKSGKKIPFDIAKRKIQYLGINLTKEEKDLYSENCTTLKKEIKEDTNGSMCHDHGLEELTSSKWPYYPKRLIDSMQSLLKYP